MRSRTTVTLLTTLTMLSVPALANDQNGTAQEKLLEEVTSLRREVAELRAQTNADWLSEQRAEEIRSLVQDVLADADTRTSLMQDGMTAGWGSHPFLASADGNFKLEFQGQVQVRFVFNNQDSSPTDDYRWGFENRRTKLKFAGHVFDPSWGYKITGAFGNNGGGFTLEDSYIVKKFGNGWAVTFGQFKPGFMREELISSSKQLTVDRSLVNERFNQDFAQGVQVGYSADSARFKAAIHDGFGSDNVPWTTEDTEFAMTARAEFLLSGAWKPFKDFTSSRGSELAIMLGVAGHYQVTEYGTASGPEETDSRVTVDVSFESDGWNAFAAFVYQDLDVANTNPYGLVVQGGYFLTDDLEGFLRYEFGDSDIAASEDLSVITLGVNKYFNKNVKWTTDLGFALNEVDGSWDKTSVGWRQDSASKDGQVVLRSQLQVLF